MSIPGPNPQWSVQPFAGLQINSTAISASGSRMITGTSIEGGSSSDFAVYCYAGNGQLLWSDPLGANAYDGVFWVAISADGAWAAAGGSYQQSGNGFLRIYSVDGGAEGGTPGATASPASRQEFATSGRVNEVEMSADGSSVVAVFEDTVALYTRSGSAYTLASSQSFPGAYARTCAISADGTWITAGGNQDDASPTRTRRPSGPRRTFSSGTGFVKVFLNQEGSLSVASAWYPTAGVLRVVMTGAFVANANEDGSVQLYFRVMGPVYTLGWTFWPSVPVSYIYALAIGQTSDAVYVAAGGNVPSTNSGPSTGLLFMIQSLPNGAGFTPTQLWSQPLAYAPNPATNMDAAVQYVTAGVGEPHSGSETPGAFYLFGAGSGVSPWGSPYETSIMNWAMAINAAGTAIFGGSDDGFVYYWGAPA